MAVVNGYTMTCLDMIPDLEVKLGNYTLTDTLCSGPIRYGCRVGSTVVIFVGGDWVQLSDVDHELQRCQRIESCAERHVYRGASRNIDNEGGVDFSSW